MSLMIPWARFRPDTPVPACPQCGVTPDNPGVFIRHEHARYAGHAPAWIHCDCGRTYAGAVATDADCVELRP